MTTPSKRNFVLLVTSLVLGLLFIVQAKSFDNLSRLTSRDVTSNVFKEIQILSNTNKTLEDQIAELEKDLADTKDRSQALSALEKEIQKDQLFDGSIAVAGPGVTIWMPAGSSVPWLIDLINELWSSSAEAVSVNGTRLTNKTMGFDSLPQNAVMLNGNVLQPPYIFRAIGDSDTLYRVLEQPGGFIQRFQQLNKDKRAPVEKNDRIEMEKIL